MFELNNYNKLKPKDKEKIRYTQYANNLTEQLTSMFVYDNLPDTIPSWAIEHILVFYGHAIFTKINDDLYVCAGSRQGNIDAYGLGTDFVVATPIGSVNGKLNVDGVDMWNNNTMTPDFLIDRYATMLSNIDLSMEYNLKYSRLNPIPIAKDSNSYKAIEKALENIDKGKFDTILSPNISLDGTGNIDILNITDVKNIDKIQYLSQYHNDVLKQFWNLYGLPTNTAYKMAQVNRDELHASDTNSFVIPCDRLKQRKDGLEKVNEIFGTNITVDFSPAWKLQLDSLNNIGDNIGDKIGDDIGDDIGEKGDDINE